MKEKELEITAQISLQCKASELGNLKFVAGELVLIINIDKEHLNGKFSLAQCFNLKSELMNIQQILICRRLNKKCLVLNLLKT